MASRVIWMPDALSHLDQIVNYIEQSSEANARNFAVDVFAIVDSLPSQPYLGAEVPEYGRQDVRERLLHNYRIIYRLRGDVVEVLTITHGARRLPRTPPEGD